MMRRLPNYNPHFGLVGMRERAEKVRGELAVRSRPGQGTEVKLVVNTGVNGHAAP